MTLHPAMVVLRQLRDCGVVRFRFDSPGAIELFDQGLADATPVDDDEDALDYRLTKAGEVVAKAALS